jgi:hypothetical protein
MTQSEAAPVSVAVPQGTRTGRGAWLVLAVGNFVASLSSSALVWRYGRTTLTAGAVFQIAGLLVLLTAASPGRPTALLLTGVTLFGLGQGLLIPPIIGLVLSRIPVADSGAPAGVLAGHAGPNAAPQPPGRPQRVAPPTCRRRAA